MATVDEGTIQQPKQMGQPRQDVGAFGPPGWQDQLIDILLEQAMSPMPKAPQAPQQQPLPWYAAVAGALNPQMVPFYQQKANAPGQAQYQNQMAAFEQAMGARQGAQKDLTGLLGRDLTGQYGFAGRMAGVGLGYENLAERERHNRAMEAQAGNKGPDWRIAYSPDGWAYWVQKPQGAATQAAPVPVDVGGGRQAGRPLSEGAVSKITVFRTLRDKGEAIRDRLLGPGGAGGGYVDKAGPLERGATRIGRNVESFLTGAADITSYVSPDGATAAANLQDLTDYLQRIRSGAQINEDEYKRLNATLPSIGENPEVIKDKLQRFFAELDSIERERGSMQAGVGSMSGPMTNRPRLPRNVVEQMKVNDPQAYAEFVEDGGEAF